VNWESSVDVMSYLRKVLFSSFHILVQDNEQYPQGGGGYSRFQVLGMIEWEQNSKPKKSLNQKLTPKKSLAKFPRLKNFQKR